MPALLTKAGIFYALPGIMAAVFPAMEKQVFKSTSVCLLRRLERAARGPEDVQVRNSASDNNCQARPTSNEFHLLATSFCALLIFHTGKTRKTTLSALQMLNYCGVSFFSLRGQPYDFFTIIVLVLE